MLSMSQSHLPHCCTPTLDVHDAYTKPWWQSLAHGFRATSLYVTEGGGFTKGITNRRIVEIPNMRAPVVETKDDVQCWTYQVGLG